MSKRKNSHRISDEVLLTVLSRMPTRDAVRCAALSRHHRRLIGSLDFSLLHRRFGPPTAHPHVAYMVSSMLPGQLFNEFHLAAGNGLRRALIDRETMDSRRQRYVGTCNGVVILATECFYSNRTVVLLNPAIAGSEEVVGMNLDCNWYGKFGPRRVSGFGYGQSSRRHKLLVTKLGSSDPVPNDGVITYNVEELMVYTFGRLNPEQQPRCRTVPSSRPFKFNGSSV
jgi:hypothetical protein